MLSLPMISRRAAADTAAALGQGATFDQLLAQGSLSLQAAFGVYNPLSPMWLLEPLTEGTERAGDTWASRNPLLWPWPAEGRGFPAPASHRSTTSA